MKIIVFILIFHNKLYSQNINKLQEANTWTFDTSDYINIVGIVATFLLSFVALFKDYLIKLIFKEKIKNSISINPKITTTNYNKNQILIVTLTYVFHIEFIKKYNSYLNKSKLFLRKINDFECDDNYKFLLQNNKDELNIYFKDSINLFNLELKYIIDNNQFISQTNYESNYGFNVGLDDYLYLNIDNRLEHYQSNIDFNDDSDNKINLKLFFDSENIQKNINLILEYNSFNYESFVKELESTFNTIKGDINNFIKCNDMLLFINKNKYLDWETKEEVKINYSNLISNIESEKKQAKIEGRNPKIEELKIEFFRNYCYKAVEYYNLFILKDIGEKHNNILIPKF